MSFFEHKNQSLTWPINKNNNPHNPSKESRFRIKMQNRIESSKIKERDGNLKEGMELAKRSIQDISVGVAFLGLSEGKR